MPFQLSPGVVVTETDLTTYIPAVATSIGGFVGNFQWGPVNQIKTVESEERLNYNFGNPNSNTAISYYTAANFLSYSQNLKVVRVVGAAARNAVSNAAGGTAVVLNDEQYLTTYPAGNALVGEFAAKYPGTLGNSIRVSVADANSYTGWAFANLFVGAPGTSEWTSARGGRFDEMHVVIADADGKLSGTAGTVLETFPFLSKASDAKKFDGASIYYRQVLNDQSRYLWWMRHPTAGTNWGSESPAVTFANLAANVTTTLSGGVDANPVNANLQAGWDLFVNEEAVDVNFLITGDADSAVTNYVTQSIAEVRKDAMVFCSPPLANVLNRTAADAASSVLAYRNSLTSSSFAVLDSGWKYQYDRINDTYRWIPLNGDIAGLAARTDLTNDPWWSPAGLNRGQIKNVIKLAYSPTKANRDDLYVRGVNPVVSIPGEGVVLYGDKTLLSRPSAFDRINVRRLFIVLEKAIATAAKYSLFEFNDDFTRARFVSMVEPYLRGVQGRRGITDFKVVCDTTNNTPEVIDRNEFVASIFIKPTRSINFITLNFVATRTGISFDEVGA